MEQKKNQLTPCALDFTDIRNKCHLANTHKRRKRPDIQNCLLWKVWGEAWRWSAWCGTRQQGKRFLTKRSVIFTWTAWMKTILFFRDSIVRFRILVFVTRALYISRDRLKNECSLKIRTNILMFCREQEVGLSESPSDAKKLWDGVWVQWALLQKPDVRQHLPAQTAGQKMSYFVSTQTSRKKNVQRH